MAWDDERFSHSEFVSRLLEFSVDFRLNEYSIAAFTFRASLFQNISALLAHYRDALLGEFSAIDVDSPLQQLDRLSGEADDAFDVPDLWISRIYEHHEITAVHLPEEAVYHEAVTGKDGVCHRSSWDFHKIEPNIAVYEYGKCNQHKPAKKD